MIRFSKEWNIANWKLKDFKIDEVSYYKQTSNGTNEDNDPTNEIKQFY